MYTGWIVTLFEHRSYASVERTSNRFIPVVRVHSMWTRRSVHSMWTRWSVDVIQTSIIVCILCSGADTTEEFLQTESNRLPRRSFPHLQSLSMIIKYYIAHIAHLCCFRSIGLYTPISSWMLRSIWSLAAIRVDQSRSMDRRNVTIYVLIDRVGWVWSILTDRGSID